MITQYLLLKAFRLHKKNIRINIDEDLLYFYTILLEKLSKNFKLKMKIICPADLRKSLKNKENVDDLITYLVL